MWVGHSWCRIICTETPENEGMAREFPSALSKEGQRGGGAASSSV